MEMKTTPTTQGSVTSDETKPTTEPKTTTTQPTKTTTEPTTQTTKSTVQPKPQALKTIVDLTQHTTNTNPTSLHPVNVDSTGKVDTKKEYLEFEIGHSIRVCQILSSIAFIGETQVSKLHKIWSHKNWQLTLFDEVKFHGEPYILCGMRCLYLKEYEVILYIFDQQKKHLENIKLKVSKTLEENHLEVVKNLADEPTGTPKHTLLLDGCKIFADEFDHILKTKNLSYNTRHNKARKAEEITLNINVDLAQDSTMKNPEVNVNVEPNSKKIKEFHVTTNANANINGHCVGSLKFVDPKISAIAHDFGLLESFVYQQLSTQQVSAIPSDEPLKDLKESVKQMLYMYCMNSTKKECEQWMDSNRGWIESNATWTNEMKKTHNSKPQQAQSQQVQQQQTKIQR